MAKQVSYSVIGTLKVVREAAVAYAAASGSCGKVVPLGDGRFGLVAAVRYSADTREYEGSVARDRHPRDSDAELDQVSASWREQELLDEDLPTREVVTVSREFVTSDRHEALTMARTLRGCVKSHPEGWIVTWKERVSI